MEKIPKNLEIPATEGVEKKNYKIKVICSNCKVDMGEKEGGHEENEISHSLCPKCLKELYPGYGVK